MSSHDYTGCQDLACDLCAVALICPCLFCKHTRRVVVTHLTPTINPAAWDAEVQARWESCQVCDCGPCGHMRSKQRQAKLDTGELSE